MEKKSYVYLMNSLIAFQHASVSLLPSISFIVCSPFTSRSLFTTISSVRLAPPTMTSISSEPLRSYQKWKRKYHCHPHYSWCKHFAALKIICNHNHDTKPHPNMIKFASNYIIAMSNIVVDLTIPHKNPLTLTLLGISKLPPKLIKDPMVRSLLPLNTNMSSCLQPICTNHFLLDLEIFIGLPIDPSAFLATATLPMLMP